jgi:hypothetical protein
LRGSVINGASLSAMPIDFSTSASNMTPPSEVMRKRCGGDGAGFELTIGVAADPAATRLGW